MKKELALLSGMVAMSAVLSSCCCKRGAEYTYAQHRQQVNATAPAVVNYKGGGKGVAPVRRATYQQPVQKVQPVVQPCTTYVQQPVAQPRQVVVRPAYAGPMVVPSPGVVEAHMDYSNSGVMYNASNGSYGGVIYGHRGGHISGVRYMPNRCAYGHVHRCR